MVFRQSDWTMRKLLLPLMVMIVVGLMGRSAVRAGVEGGLMSGGIDGSYFANGHFAGKPAFTRRDDRVDFNWGRYRPVGGSNTPKYHNFPRSNFSVRWNGRVLPGYSGKYIFTVASDDGAVLSIQGPGADTPQTIIDSRQSGKVRSQPVQLAAGKPYRLVLSYRHMSGVAYCRLLWNKVGVPARVIGPVRAQGINASAWAQYVWANAVRGASRWFKGKANARGELTGNGELAVYAGGGTYNLLFHGKAKVTLALVTGDFTVGSKKYAQTIPAGAGYDPATNTTTALLHILGNRGLFFLTFNNTRKTASAAAGTGIRHVQLYMPMYPGAKKSEPVGTVVYAPIRRAFSHFTVIRWLEQANLVQSGQWRDRTVPADLFFTRGPGGIFNNNNGGECWEDLVMLANETGKDLYITMPVAANRNYFRKLALLLKYGSDGREPYTSMQSHPAYPPLNPNLKVYFEVGNEIWNWAFGSSSLAAQISAREIKQHSPAAKIFNYNGHGNYRTWQAWRLVVASNVFRKVFGNKAMGSRIRPLLEYQYNNGQLTAWLSLNFLDGYFDNGTGHHVAHPHPVNYYIWGGGGATYYGVGNPLGIQHQTRVADAGFEQPVLADYSIKKDPVGTAWHFHGDAGIYRWAAHAVAGFRGGKLQPDNTRQAVGMRFQVESRPIFIHALGGYINGSMPPVDVVLLNAASHQVLAQVQLPTQRFHQSFSGVFLARLKAPLRLEAGQTYDVLERPVQYWSWHPFEVHGAGMQVKAGPGVSVLGPVQALANGPDASHWQRQFKAQAGRGYGPVDFSYTATASPTTAVDLPRPVTGAQAAFIRGTGSMEQTVNFAKPGDYALMFNAAGAGRGWPAYGPFQIYCDRQNASPAAQNSDLVAPVAAIGGFARQITNLREPYGSAVFHIAKAGPHVIRIQGVARLGVSPKTFTVFDNIQICCVAAIIKSGFGSGQALGQIGQSNYARQLDAQAQYPTVFGLHVAAYEAGWSLGGDFGSVPIQIFTKYHAAGATTINNAAGEIFARSGGYLNTWGVYQYWPAHGLVHAGSYPLMKSIIHLADTVPPVSDAGIVVPATLSAANAIQWTWQKPTAQLAQPGAWLSWVVCNHGPHKARYKVQVQASGKGRYDVLVDGREVAVDQSAKAHPVEVSLSPGDHGILVRCASGIVAVQKVTCH